MTRILQSQTRIVSAFLLGEELTKTDYAVTGVATDIIAPHVKERENLKGFAELSADLESNGMINPIILLPNTEHNYEMASRGVIKDLLYEYDPRKLVLAYSGNQRLEIAKQMEVDVIDSILCEDVRWAHAISLQLNGELQNETEMVSTQR